MENERRKKRPCAACGTDLNLWGPDRKGICPDCAKAKRKTMMVCAGRCKRLYELGRMEAVSISITPGKKGGKKFTLYYCSSCISQVASRARTVSDEQQGEIAKTMSRLKRRKGEKQDAKT